MPINADYHYLLKQEANFNKKKPDHITTACSFTCLRGFRHIYTSGLGVGGRYSGVVYRSFWATVTNNGPFYATGPLSCHLSVLSVTLVHCGQTVGCIRIPFGMEVGLGPDDIVLDGDQAPPRKKTQHPLPNCLGHVCCGHRSHVSATAELLSIYHFDFN